MTLVRTSPSGPLLNVGGGAIQPLENLTYVDAGTTVPLADRDGSIAAPYGTIQAAIDAGHFSIMFLKSPISAPSDVVVIPPLTTAFLTIASPTIGQISSLTIPDTCAVILNNIVIVTLTAGNSVNIVFEGPGRVVSATMGNDCTIEGANAAVGGAACTFGNNAYVSVGGDSGGLPGPCTFGTGATILVGSPNARSFASTRTIPEAGAVTAGASSTITCTNAVITGVLTVENVNLDGCRVTAGGAVCTLLSIQNSRCNAGTFTVSGTAELQDVKSLAPVVYTAPNIAGRFLIDGFSNYWIKTNAVTITNPAATLITEDLVP